MTAPRLCRHCHKPLSEDAHPSRLYHPECHKFMRKEYLSQRYVKHLFRRRGYHFTGRLGADYVALKLAGYVVPDESRQIRLKP